ncbi:EAL domain-containing protein [Oceanobacillus sp. CAU 1775]
MLQIKYLGNVSWCEMWNDQNFSEDQTKIIRLISEGVALEDILYFILRSLKRSCQTVPVYGSILLFRHSDNQLKRVISQSLPKDYQRKLEQVEVGPYEGSCGTAAFFRKTVIVSDILHDPLWDKYREDALNYGFKACCSIPILSTKKELLGTFALYYKTTFLPDPIYMQKVDNYIRLASIAIEMAYAETSNVGYMYKIDENKENDLLRSQFREALERNEFELYFQPSFGIQNKDICMEALLRWNHPNTGLLAPASFLGVLEKTGFILEIEEWVLKHAVCEAKKLKEEGLPHLKLAVNISAQQLEDEDFPAKVADILKLHSFPPEHLTLEITERFLVKQENVAALKSVRKAGVRVSIDDFGTSYSSLQYLKDLPVDEIKIDRSFIRELATSVDNQKIVEMIIELGHQLGLLVVAEGVETEEQLDILRSIQCDRFQGFLFSKPLPLNEFKMKYMEEIQFN